MLKNRHLMGGDCHVEFVKYTGREPNLCGGILTLRIDGEEVRFGNTWNNVSPTDYPKFWRSGGSCSGTHAVRDEWEIDVELIPPEYRKYAAEIDEVMNANVEHGCCGGCS